MAVKRFFRRIIRYANGSIVFLILFVVIFAAFFKGIGQISDSRSEEALRAARDSFRRAVVSCYAIEGFYPDNPQYILDNYGVAIDQSRYFIHYEIFASNLMPDIDVIPLEADGKGTR